MKKTVFNRRLITPPIFAVLFIALGFGSLFVVDTDIVAAIVMFVIAAGFLLFLFMQPICFVFEEDKLTIRYFFGFHEIVYREKIRKALLCSVNAFIPFFHSKRYQFVVEGGTQGKKASFTSSVVTADKKTARCVAEFLPEGLQIEDRT